jgi:hypothetical protein
MKRLVFVFLGLAFTLAAFADVEYFRSNEIGITLEKIAWYRTDEFEYVVTLEAKGNTHIKRLYKNRVEIKHWETVYDNRLRKLTESEYEGSALVSVLVYNKDGGVAEEYLYTGNELSEKKIYKYSKKGLARVETFDKQEQPVYTDYYSLSRAGRLRSVIRVWANGNMRLSRFEYGSGILVEQREYLDPNMYITRFDSRGRVISWEQWRDDTLEKSRVVVYNSETGTITREEETDHLKSTTTVRTYNEHGELVSEQSGGQSDKNVEVRYEYDEKGRLSIKRVKGPLGIEEWKYFYTDADKLAREEYWRRGFLEKITYYAEEGGYYEDIYRDNEVFLRVYYKNDKKVKEEFIVDGKVEKTRTFEENQ